MPTLARSRLKALGLAAGLTSAALALPGLRGNGGEAGRVPVASAQSQEAYVLAERWSGPTGLVAAGYVRGATGSAVDETGRLYVVDAARKQVHVWANGSWVDTWGGVRGNRETLADPKDIAVFGGRAYVADAAAGRVKVYSSEGAFLEEWADMGRPWGVAPYGTDRLLVTDNMGSRVLLLDLAGRIRAELIGPGQLLAPQAVASWPDGTIAVLNAGHDRVDVFASDGTLRLSIPNTSGLPLRDIAAFGDDGLLVAGLRFLYHYERDTGNNQAGSRAPVPGGFTTVASTLTPGMEWDLPIYATFDHDYMFGLRRFSDSRFLQAEEFQTLPGPAGEFASPKRIEAAGTDGVEILDAWPRSQWLPLDGRAGTQVVLDTAPSDVVHDGSGTRFFSTGGGIRRMDASTVTWRWVPPSSSTWLVGLAGDGSGGPCGGAGSCSLIGLDVQAQRFVRVGVTGTLMATPTLGTNSYQSFTDLAVAPGGRIMVVNRTLARVEIRDTSGSLMDSWQVTGVPLRVAPDASGGAFVLTREGWIWHLNASGTAVGWWDPAADAPGRRGAPSDVAYGADGRVYVADERANEVRIYALDPDATGDSGPGGEGCTFIRDKWAEPRRIALGRTVDVTLTVSGACLEAGQGADVMLVIDRSGSMAGTKMDGARAAAVEFVGEMDFNVSRVGVVLFSSDAAMPVGLSSDPASIVDAIVGFGPPSGGTDIGEGVEVATSELVSNGRAGVDKIIIVMTDGRPEGDVVDADAASSAAKASGIHIYSIGFGVDVDPVLMQRIASTPDDYFFAPGSAELSAIYTEIARRITGGVIIASGVITDVVPSNMVLLEETISPPPTVVTGREIRWDVSGVRGDLEFTYRLRPTQTGVWPTNVEAWMAYVDGLDASGRLPFPVPEVEVVAPRTIYLPFAAKAFCKPTQIHADTVLVIDASSSMEGPKLEAAKIAAESFVNRLQLPDDHAAVIAFSSTPRLAAGLTGDIGELRRAIQAIEWQSGTVVDTALDAATAELTGPRARARATHVVVLLTDGRNNGGPEPVLAAAERARAAGVIIFTVSLGDDADRELMTRVAGDPARSFVALAPEDLERIYEEIAGVIPCQAD